MSIHRARTPSLILGASIIALTSWATESEAYAATCEANLTLDNGAVPKTLRWCVEQAALGHYDTVIMRGSATYVLDSPLLVTGTVKLLGKGADIEPSSTFVGDSLIELDNSAFVALNQVDLRGAGSSDVRGVFANPGATLKGEQLTVTGFTTTQDGAGIYLDDADAFLNTSGLHDNYTDSNGGGLYVDPSSVGVTVELLDVEITNNEASSAGAIDTGNGSTVLFALDSDFHNNVTMLDAGAVLGGGHFERCSFRHNEAMGVGGAIDSREHTAVLIESSFHANVAATGGAIATGGTLGDLTVRRSALFENQSTAELGGAGIHVDGGIAKVVNSTFAYNESQGAGTGAGAISVDAGAATLEYLTMAYNDANGGPGGLRVSASASAALHNSLLRNFAPDCDLAGPLTAATSFASDTTCGTGVSYVPGSIVAACSGSDQDYHCDPASSLQGLATCTEPLDQLGNGRPQTACMPGAFEGP